MKEPEVTAILRELKALGLTDSHVKKTCGFSAGYVSKLRSGAIKEPSYSAFAKLWNLLVDARQGV